MSCEEIRQTLSPFIDDRLTPHARAACEEHLRACPGCRAEMDALRDLSRSLSALRRPAPPQYLSSSIRSAIRIEAGALERVPVLPLGQRLSNWLRPRLFPYTVGTLASVFLFTLIFSALRPHLKALAEAALLAQRDDTSYKIYYVGPDADINSAVTAEALAAQRRPFNTESPSLNPRGALAALTNSHSHTLDGEDDMVVVTDVFSNGRASLADVVQAPRDRRMLDDFQDALQKNAAFVPASYDRRPETMRVVFVVQKVAVPEKNF